MTLNFGNKENLLKMEIERLTLYGGGTSSNQRNKENLLKMEIESFSSTKGSPHGCGGKQRKSPENGD